MDDRQLTGVLAHELSHVKNRDTLVGTIAATIGGAISFIAQMAQFQMIFGGGSDDDNGGGGFGALVAIILAPIAALIIQLAVSRSREYGADGSGAALTGDPEGLAQALERLEAANSQHGLRARLPQRMPARARRPGALRLRRRRPTRRSPACTSSTRCRAGSSAGLFSTHPPVERAASRGCRAMARRDPAFGARLSGGIASDRAGSELASSRYRAGQAINQPVACAPRADCTVRRRGAVPGESGRSWVRRGRPGLSGRRGSDDESLESTPSWARDAEQCRKSRR